MDRQTNYSISLYGPRSDIDDDEINRGRIQQQLVDFVLDFHLDNVFVYR